MRNVLKKIIKYIKSPRKIIIWLNEHHFAPLFSDKFYLKCLYHDRMGKKLNLKNPQTFNEKLQWLKLYNRKSEYTIMADKYLARNYIAEKIGEGHSIPLLGVWDNPEEIDFDALPDQFVLKCNHNSGLGMCICKDKSTLDIEKVKQELAKGLKENYFLHSREWPYKNVPRKIIAEKYMKEEANNGEECLTDYKWFCFNGQPKLVYISKDNATVPCTDFFDMAFNHVNMRMKDRNSDVLPEKPVAFDKMKEFATILSQGVPHLRVDFYYINGQIYVGELTFFHNSGFSKIHPEEWDYKLGEWIKLPKDK